VIEQSRRELRDRVCKERLCGLLTVLLLERRKVRNVLCLRIVMLLNDGVDSPSELLQ
jgi:hypothetical protein